ncbi:MAG: formate--tetrahydrofolate ligase [Spirochaetales bacterium]|nr:formate--tetrahydrofolate ligase [Spirochaetales bacterium]
MNHETDLSIAQRVTPQSIFDVAHTLGLSTDRLYPIGPYIAKVLNQDPVETPKKRGRLILVTAMNPTKAGEGKTTVTVGLGDALALLGKRTCVTLREPSMGPVFGVKGGAAGGGRSQVIPMEDLNLHFTGDIHAVTSAHNLLSALVDNHIHFRKSPRLDGQKVNWHRVLDMNDRSLRSVILGAGPESGTPRVSSFSITAASEIMAILCPARDSQDLRNRLSNIIVGESEEKELVRVGSLDFQGALSVVLHRAIYPNLVQTLVGTPVLVHGGPFANIAHGTNSLIADNLALEQAEFVVTEAGFGADLGGQKFLDLVSPIAGFSPDGVVVVATLRAIKHHGGAKDFIEPNTHAIINGIANLLGHLENLRDVYGQEPVAAINEFPGDLPREIGLVQELLTKAGFQSSLTQVWAKGAEGGVDLAQKVLSSVENTSRKKGLTNRTLGHGAEPGSPVHEAVEKVAQTIYGAKNVSFSPQAQKSLDQLAARGLDRLPICMAKTQYSFSADPNLRGRPRNFEYPVRDLKVSGGAGFVVVFGGDIMTMPGLSPTPAAMGMDISPRGTISGLF